MAEYTKQIQSWLFASEGGYVNNPKDPGGATNFGITLKTLSAWRGKTVSKTDVRNLSKEEASVIMKTQYWDRMFCDRMPVGLDYALYDYGVNSGVSKAVKDLQRCLGNLYTGTVDGIVGTQTLDAVRKVNNVTSLIVSLCERRYAFVRSLKTFKTFGNGWTIRIMGKFIGVQPGQDIGVIDRAVMLAKGRTDIHEPKISTPKADVEENSFKDIVKKPETLGIVAGPIATFVAAISDNVLLTVVVAIIALAFALPAAWFFFKRMKEADNA